ncbi:Hypothetical protein PHPALM_4185 [Phytophthora palmivora]|uniref:DUSP domain-containing protein n=1 Tax=Phytophthora palmivora TaxID=4796 RepID=A0A2P4YKG9_9STRA|nr:Hypothetical protein PHPALM_4185 [Phytophthora palmivora]
MVKSKTPALQRAKELSDSAPLEEGSHWFAVATPWWGTFHSCPVAKDAPKVRNDALIDKLLSSKVRKVAILKPNLEEGSDFVLVPESSWDVIARELDYDWEIRREVIYHRSQQELQLEPYPFTFKIFYWTTGETEPVELVDETDRGVVVLGSRVHTLGQLFSEVWLSAPDDFRQKFPQLLSDIDPMCLPTNSRAVPKSSQIRVCLQSVRASDGKVEWMPIEKMQKRTRVAPTSLTRLKPRAKKRQARDCDDESSDNQQSEVEGEESEVDELHYSGQFKTDPNGLSAMMNVKLGNLRLDNRSEVASGDARLHKVLIEQKSHGSSEGMSWQSQGHELQWRMDLTKGDTLDAFDTSRSWFEARLLAAKRNKVLVHYRGWESKWDEWILRTSPRIAPPYSRVSKWRSALRPHSLVQIGLQVPRLKHVKWRNATVIEVTPSTDDDVELVQGGSDGIGLRVHVHVDNDEIWLPAHDDLLCRSNTHNESSALTKRERQLLSHDDSFASDSSDAPEGDGEDNILEIDGGEDDNETNLMDRSSSSSSRPPKLINAARVGPARDLNASFRQVQDHGRSSPGRTPARRRNLGRTQGFSDDTSPEPVSPTKQLNSRTLKTLWTQVGNDLQALQSSWGELGESLVALIESSKRTTAQG